MTSLLAAVAVVFLAPHATQRSPDADGPPRVATLEPADGAEDVDAAKVKTLVVTFDRSMTTEGWSYCGGGPEFPKLVGKPRWETPMRIVVDVELEPDQEYRLGLNGPVARNFKSADGVSLEPTSWSFSTAAVPAADSEGQKAENQAAFDALKKLLAESYSYYDLRPIVWDALFREHEAKILGATSTQAWARTVARMLAVTQDIHMVLVVGGRTYATDRRTIAPLYYEALLTKYLVVQPLGRKSRCGRTEDGIGYLMIPMWSDRKEIDAIEAALPALRDCKAIVVDVRPNSGGDELQARRIAAWFVEGTRVYAKHRYRTGPGKDGFGPVVDRSIQGNQDTAKRLTMPVAVLTSRHVASSNESFVLMMRQAADCTVVGQRTYGSSGNPRRHQLPNGVSILVPAWQDLRPDGTCFEGEGLVPDVEVAVDPEELAEKDPILERGLAVLREKLAAGSGAGK